MVVLGVPFVVLAMPATPAHNGQVWATDTQQFFGRCAA
jgi:hypothetical protein